MSIIYFCKSTHTHTQHPGGPGASTQTAHQGAGRTGTTHTHHTPTSASWQKTGSRHLFLVVLFLLSGSTVESVNQSQWEVNLRQSVSNATKLHVPFTGTKQAHCDLIQIIRNRLEFNIPSQEDASFLEFSRVLQCVLVVAYFTVCSLRDCQQQRTGYF